ncbi:MAG: hypothetical protein ACRD2W_04815 [Acidimicrobiales bacterium]
MTNDLERVLEPPYLEDLASLDDAELRSRRHESQQVEAKLSYLRRLVQGRLDIVSAEIDRRATGGTGGDLSDLVARLPEILADRVRAPGPGRMPTNLVPPDDEDLTVELDEVSGPGALGALPDLPDAELRAVAGRLRDLEQRVSSQRRQVFDVIDALQAELTGRYEQSDRDHAT